MPDQSYSIQSLTEALGASWQQFADWAESRLPQPAFAQVPSWSNYSHGYHVAGPRLYSATDVDDWRQVAIDAITWELTNVKVDWMGLFEDVVGRIPVGGSKKKATDALFRRKKKFRARLDAIYDLLRSGRHEEMPYFFGWGEEVLGEDGKLLGVTELTIENYRRVRSVLGGAAQLEECFWINLVEQVHHDIPPIRTLAEKIATSVPLDESDQSLLLALMPERYAVLRFDEDEASRLTVRRVMEVSFTDPINDVLGANTRTLHDRYAKLLFEPLVSDLAEALVASQPWPRSVATCRSPFCGQQFYSGRAGAKTCPRQPGSGRRSPCKAAWEAYQKWLQKLGRDPEVAWSEEELKQKFMEQYEPRGPQSQSY